MKMFITLVGAVLMLSASVNGQCALNCAVATTCYATAAEAMACMDLLPFNETIALNNLNVLSQSLENFGFGALYHSTGPPYSINLDIQGRLEETRNLVTGGTFANDISFQEYVQSIFQLTLDAHTRYQKPVCYNAVFVQPVAFDVRIEDGETEPAFFFMPSVYAAQYATVTGIDTEYLVGQKIALINGMEPTTEISQWGDSHETRSNNRGIRFNSAIRSYLYRSAIAVNIVPLGDLVFTLANGEVVTLPWIASYTNRFAEYDYCLAVKVTAEEEELTAKALPKSHRAVSPFSPSQQIQEDQPPVVLHSSLNEQRSDRTVILPVNSTYYVSCFTQTIEGTDANTAGVEKVLVLKVASFSPPGEDYIEAWTGFLNDAQTCLSVPNIDLIVVDVMQNGGGYVCLGLRLIELLVEDYENDHRLVQMNYDLPHSKLMDAYIQVVNAPDPYPDPKAVEQILNPATQESFVDGNAWYHPGRNVTQGGVVSLRSNWFALDCREAEAMPGNNWRPSKFMTADKLIILTDGTCGSTCASFTKIPQEAGKATFVGAGGLWNEDMDVSSFAGGFVCQPKYLQYLSQLSGLTFPMFMTNQNWQFGWAAWYSSILPSRPVQFTVQSPTYRQAFWGFPHASVSSATTTTMVSNLYDDVITSTVSRLAAAVVPEQDSETCSQTENTVLIVICCVLGLMLLTATTMYCLLLGKYNAKGYKSLSVDGGPEPDPSKVDPFLGTRDREVAKSTFHA